MARLARNRSRCHFVLTTGGLRKLTVAFLALGQLVPTADRIHTVSHAAKTVAVLAFVGLTLSACTDELDGQGGMMTGPTPTVTATHDAFDDPDMGRGGPADSAEPVVEDVEPTPAPDPAPTVGTVTLNWEVAQVSNRLFSYDLTQCSIDGTDISVEGIGAEDATGAPSTLSIDVTDEELLHSGTGTYQARGHVTFTADGAEMISDGRIDPSAEGHNFPSMFTYRFEQTTAKFVVTWWAGSEVVGNGAVNIECDE